MNMTKHINRFWLTVLSGMLLTMQPSISGAAPGTISNTPLFSSTRAEPNIFFMIDDSGSMNTEMLSPEYVATWGGLMELSTDAPNTRSYRFVFATGSSSSSSLGNHYKNYYVMPTQAALDAVGYAGGEYTSSIEGAWRARNADYNKAYYDPTKTYGTWAGVNSAGTEYSGITVDVTKTPVDPYTFNASSSSTYINITQDQTVTTRRPNTTGEGGTYTNLTFTYYPASYWVWEDDDVDGNVEPAETKKLIQIKNTMLKCTNGLSATKTEQRTENAGAGCLLRDYADEIKNFYNWFAYHRRRESSATYALSSVISSTTGVRMGIATIHNDAANEEQSMLSMNTDPASGNKKTLLDALYSMHTAPSTPLIEGLVMAGQYFACSTDAGSAATPFGSAGSTNCAIEASASAPATTAAGMCQQNFTILVSDGDYTDNVPSTVSAVINDSDGDESIWAGTNHATSTNYNFNFDKKTYKDATYSLTLADAAMYYYENDLNSTLENRVSVQCGVDENPSQHMVTYGVGLGVTGSIDQSTIPDHPQQGYIDGCTSNVASASTFGWVDPASGAQGEGKIDDFLHATYNGRGEYLSASDPATLTTALQSTIQSITDRTGSSSSVSFNSASLQTGSKLYLALFNTSKWSGDLKSYTLNPNTGDVTTEADDWTVADQLDTRSLSSAPRDIFTYSGTDGVAFTWATLPATLVNDLNTSASGSGDALGEQRLNYLRGDRSDEGTGDDFRIRAKRLGDIVHSTPIYVGESNVGWPDIAPFPTASGSTYSDYSTGTLSTTRTPVVYIGGNDGMLHGFKATSSASEGGKEVFAYVPEYLNSTSASEGLHYLTNKLYTHRYYVDMPPTVSDAFIKTTTAGTVGWHTILIGGSRAGARGLFALDISDPTKFDEDNATDVSDVVMWEFDSGDDPNLGYSFSRPTIALSNATDGSNNRWVAIFGNGYNDTSSGAGNGDARLFILFLDGGIDGVWTAGTDYIEIATEVGTTANRNGLSTPTLVDTDGNGTVDRVYAGDLKGNMWAFDLSNATASNWDVAYKQGANPKPLFTAKDSGGTAQPITTQPVVVDHPTVAAGGGNSPNLMILFGTGQYIVEGDKTSTGVQSYYSVWDEGTKELLRADLGSQTTAAATSTARVLTDNAIAYSGGSAKNGWYYDFDSTTSPVSGELGERIVTKTVIYDDDYILYYTTVPSIEPCDSGGNSWLMAHKIENGGRPSEVLFDADDNGSLDDYLDVGGTDIAVSGGKTTGITTGDTLGEYLYDSSTDDDTPGKTGLKKLSGSGQGRLSWEELSL